MDAVGEVLSEMSIIDGRSLRLSRSTRLLCILSLDKDNEIPTVCCFGINSFIALVKSETISAAVGLKVKS